jgi:hypothetical protein
LFHNTGLAEDRLRVLLSDAARAQTHRIFLLGWPGVAICSGNAGVRAARLIGRLIFRHVGSSIFPVAGFAGNAFRFAFIGNFLIELIDDAL